MKPTWLALAIAALVAPSSESQAQVAYDSPNGRVEVLGLRRWTLDMLRDSIRRYAPGQELHDAACMVTLRDSLHFAEAYVSHFMLTPPGVAPERSFLTIKVVEPEQAARVQWDVRYRNEFSSLLPDYAPLIQPITDTAGNVWRGRLLAWLQFANDSSRERAFGFMPAKARPDGERVFAFLDSHRADSDRQRAMRVLTRDGHWVNRMTAAAILGNFPAHDSTWWALARALRDPHEGVREAAGSVIQRLPARAVDWRPAAKDLRLLLGGTNLPEIQSLFDVLARTQVSPAMASTLLRDNADWVLDHLVAETPNAGYAAHQLLIRLNNGRDLGRTREAWATWIRTL